jgi:outer membrane receptor protein involved in Fe transport
VESNIDWRVTEALTLSASATYTDAYLTKTYCLDPSDLTTCTPSGTQLPITPRLKANGIARYDFKWGDYTSHVQGALVYNGAAWPALVSSDRANLGEMPAYVTADFSAGIGLNNWSLELYVDNAFDEHGQNDRFIECSICQAQVYITPIEPRLIGLKFAQKY